MPVSVRSAKDFWMGLLYGAIGIAALLIGRNYDFGTAARMGPGFLPTIVAVLLIAIGAISVLRSLRVEGEEVEAPKLLPIFLVLGSVIAFSLLVDTAGFFISGLVLLLVSGRASRYFQFNVRILLGAMALVALSALVFIKVLGVSMPMFGLLYDLF